ncbi:hypothetical protein NEISICOT_03659 [Neisseria sicca ATCC 29256]|uniref:Uncharacterized protein n=1 Tax=Neisseria sicca ATCC 29256 TaxID=547045 RepID=C6MAS7_NEISI|nr:hypothetical protein NEISICOT_03659 [Neisseria sicca ATCC 29256]
MPFIAISFSKKPKFFNGCMKTARDLCKIPQNPLNSHQGI